MKIEAKADYLFEVSWEVCNHVGGIYTVLKSKAHVLQSYYKNYCFIGPFMPEEAKIRFEGKQIPKHLSKIFSEMEKEGLTCHYGDWLLEGAKAETILIEYKNYLKKVDDIKREFWDLFKVNSLNAPGDYNEYLAWSYATGMLLEKIEKILKNKKVIAHFHEYISGAALLYLKKNKSKIKTVFTTHATILGRILASRGIPLYENLNKIDPMEEASKYWINSKYTLELACAKHADVFTTVSGITAIEAKALLGEKVDVILPNGLDISKFPPLEERAILHRKFKHQLHDFIRTYFFPYHRFDVDNSLIYFITGRYEFENKGIDVFIEALGRLNKSLVEKKTKNPMTIFVFIWIPAKVKGINKRLLENKILFEGIENFVSSSVMDIKDTIIHSIVEQKMPTTKELFSDEFKYNIKKKMFEFKKKGIVPLATHDLADDDNDKIIKALNKNGLNNSSRDRVKVIFNPVYLTGADGLLDLAYYDAIAGCHLGVFPSYYEPWGYTPLETGALGVPFITTDLAGFGRYIIKNKQKGKGVMVLKRDKRSRKQIVADLTKYLEDFSKLDLKNRIEAKLQAKRMADTADWNRMIVNYIKAHNMAVSKSR